MVGGEPPKRFARRSAPNGQRYSAAAASSSVAGVRLADVQQAVAERVEHELQVAVALLGLVAVGVVPGGFGPSAAVQQRRLVGGEQIELPLDELEEAPPGGGGSHELPVELEVRARGSLPGERLAGALGAGPRRREGGRVAEQLGRGRQRALRRRRPATTRPAPNAVTGSASPPTS